MFDRWFKLITPTLFASIITVGNPCAGDDFVFRRGGACVKGEAEQMIDPTRDGNNITLCVKLLMKILSSAL